MPLQATSGAASYDAFGGGVPVVPNYIEDVFSTTLYTGDGTNNRTITTGVQSDFVWIKRRDSALGHLLFDINRGAGKTLRSQSTDAESNDGSYYVQQFNSNNFYMGATDTAINASGGTYCSWTFRKQPKFFDVVTYTGNGTSGRAVAHNLGSVPGFMIVKVTSEANNWTCWHRSITGKILELNTTAAQANDSGGGYFYSSPDATNIYLGSDWQVNKTDATYVAYLFAHDAGGFGLTGTDNVISCGSFTTDGSGLASVTLGYEPQWILVKRTDSSTAGNWHLIDTMRGWDRTADDQYLYANTSDSTVTAQRGNPTATGFDAAFGFNASYIYIAIRRGPMKVPTDGTSVFALGTSTSDTSGYTLTSNFPVDSYWYGRRDGGSQFGWMERLTNARLFTASTSAEGSVSGYVFWDSNVNVRRTGLLGNASTSNYALQRAPSFFDEVCYTGTGSATTVAHNLGVVPQLMIVKGRSNALNWRTYNFFNGSSEIMNLNDNGGSADVGNVIWNSTTPTSSVFSIGTNNSVNQSGSTFVAYLFATCAGVSKVGSYTGTATTKQIDCGFTAGARFVLIKRTDNNGSWYVWDVARGISSGNDPYLLLNSTAAEVTNTDYIDAYSAGFEISSTAPSEINASGGSFIFLAIS